MVAILAVLPSGVRCLELAASPCTGPLLPVLARFRQLQRLAITGNGADIDWAVGSPTVLASLQQLCLDYRRQPITYMDDGVCITCLSDVDSLPPSAVHALAAATALHTLELRLKWSAEAAALCRTLPALRHLR